jgi:ATP-dependent Clp protease ATP-binding subunit ClpC
VALDVTDAAVAWLGEHGYEPEYGARPLRRLIQREVDDRIADLFVSGELSDGGRAGRGGGDLRVTSATASRGRPDPRDEDA